MSKSDDSRFMQSEVYSAQSAIIITNDINKISQMTNGDIMVVFTEKGVFGSPDSGTTLYPDDDKVRMYVKHEERTYMNEMIEVTEELLTR